jgi:hypothetical protein
LLRVAILPRRKDAHLTPLSALLSFRPSCPSRILVPSNHSFHLRCLLATKNRMLFSSASDRAFSGVSTIQCWLPTAEAPVQNGSSICCAAAPNTPPEKKKRV